MDYKISKELFEAVMKCKINNYGFGTSNIGIRVVTEMFDEILITYNDFFFKCKEWALNKGYWLMTWKHKIGAGCKIFRGHLNIRVDERLDADSEQQACFDACQWILDNKDRQ